MSIVTILDLTLHGVGELRIKPLSKIHKSDISGFIIWNGSDRYGHDRKIRFGDDLWKPIGEKIGIKFDEITSHFNYELKVLALSLYTNGVGEGMPPLKWSTVVTGVRSLKHIALELTKRDITSFFELKNKPSLILRNLFSDVLYNIDAMSKPIMSHSLIRAFKWFKYYHVFNVRECIILSELLAHTLKRHAVQGSKRHPIIPTPIMKKLISSVMSEISKLKIPIINWTKTQNDEINKIKARKYKIINGCYRSTSSPVNKKIAGLLTKITYLPGLVNILVLAFTGMRDGEALSLKNNCVVRRSEKSKSIFLLETELSKTTDGNQKLEWICNESTANAIDLLVSINMVIHNKAKAILKYLCDEISSDYKNNLTFGIKRNNLFSVGYSHKLCLFLNRSKRPNGSTFNITKFFKIAVTKADILQLERLDSNYKSVSASSSERLQPYVVGDYFNFTSHEFRHTFAWFIIANRLGELDDIRYQYKHLWESMTLVYSMRGYESIGQLLNLTDEFAEELTKLTVTELVDSSLSGKIGGKGGERFSLRIKEMMGNQYSDAIQPSFKDVSQLVDFVSIQSNDLRGLSHGYCTKALDCKVKNVADPSHCIYCDGYITTEKHIPHWKAIKFSCEEKLKKIDSASDTLKHKLEAFETALKVNLETANKIIDSISDKKEELKL